MTKKAKRLHLLFSLLHILFFIGPIATYTIMGFIEGTAVVEKVGLSLTLIIVLILTLVSLVNKIALRSKVWILLVGFWLCLDNILIPLIVIAVTQVLDELIISPLKDYYKEKVHINKEMDKRGI